jgi:hypothetical protein
MNYSLFTSPIEIQGTIFYARGLTVGEYVHLVMSGSMKASISLWVKIAETCISGWEELYIENENGEVELLPFSKDSLLDSSILPIEVMIELGEKIFNSLTLLSPEEEKQFKAATRFLHFASEDNRKAVIDTFDCQTCIRGGSYKSRICGKYSKDELDEIYRELNSIEESRETSAEDTKQSDSDFFSLQNKYSNSKKKNAGMLSAPRVAEAPTSQKTMRVGDYTYPECPVSYIPDWISTLAGILYHCSKSNLTFYSGGLSDQPYKLYRAERIVAGESGKIEKEEMEKPDKGKGKKGKKGH